MNRLAKYFAAQKEEKYPIEYVRTEENGVEVYYDTRTEQCLFLDKDVFFYEDEDGNLIFKSR